MKLYLNCDCIYILHLHLEAGIEPDKLYIRWDDEGEIYVGAEGLDRDTYNRLVPMLQAMIEEDEGLESTV